MNAPTTMPRDPRIDEYRKARYPQLVATLKSIVKIVEGVEFDQAKLANILTLAVDAIDMADHACRRCGQFAGKNYDCDDCQASDAEAAQCGDDVGLPSERVRHE